MNADRNIRENNLNIHIFESKALVKLCTKWIFVNGSSDFHEEQRLSNA